MKRIFIVLILCFSVAAKAETADDLIGLGMSPELAQAVENMSIGYLLNNTYLEARNAADSADIDVLKVDATDDTVLNADTGDVIKLSVAGTSQVQVSDGALSPTTDDDIDLGSGSAEFKDLYLDGTATVDALVNSGASTLTGNVGFGGTLIGTGTATIGWAVVAGANTACTTTCTTPCVFGVNTAATEADIVDCADATADECLCAGAS